LKKEGIYRFAEMMQKVDSALLFYNRSLALYGTYESNLNNRGALYYEFYFDYLKSIKSFKKSTDFNDSYYEGMLNIGNSYCKLAEGYENMLKLLPPTNYTELKQLSKIDKIYREQKIYRTLGLLRQFEVNAIALLKSGLNTNTVNTLIVNAKNLESLDPILKNLDFSTKVSTYLTNILATKQRPSIEFIQNFRIQIIRLICVEQNVSEPEFRVNAEKLKKSYIDSAKVYFDKTYQLKPKLESYYSSLNGFAMSLSDYNMLIDVQLKYLKHFVRVNKVLKMVFGQFQ
jgi:tetratricopeptide (TPR) repeat protein